MSQLLSRTSIPSMETVRDVPIAYDKRSSEFIIEGYAKLQVQVVGSNVFRITLRPLVQPDKKERYSSIQFNTLNDIEPRMDTPPYLHENLWNFEVDDGTLALSTSPLVVYLQSLIKNLVKVRVLKKSSSHWMIGLEHCPTKFHGEPELYHEDRHQLSHLLWTENGWGLYCNNPDVLMTTSSRETSLSIHDTYCDLFLFLGHPEQILSQYANLTGHPCSLPLWAYAPWLMSSQKDQTHSFKSLQRYQDEQVDFDVLCVDRTMPCTLANQVEWKHDAERLVASLAKHKSAHCVLPVIVQSSPVFEDFADRGWLLTSEDNTVYLFLGSDLTHHEPYGLLDLSYKEAFNFWKQKLKQMSMGGVSAHVIPSVDVITDQVYARNGLSGRLLAREYSGLVKEAIIQALGSDLISPELPILNTSVGACAQRYGIHQVKPHGYTWSALQTQLHACLTLGHNGVGMAMWSIGNPDITQQRPSAVWYLRSFSLACLSGGLAMYDAETLHPWDYDEDTTQIAKAWLAFRYRLLPYLSGVHHESVRSGVPMMRSMLLAYPEDQRAHEYQNQYMLGPTLLVAPILNDDNEVVVYFPKGHAWWDLNTGERYEGGTLWCFSYDVGALPVFGKDGHMLCLGPSNQSSQDMLETRLVDEVWMFGLPKVNPCAQRNKIQVTPTRSSSYIKGLEGVKILPSKGVEVMRRGMEVRVTPVSAY